MAFDSILAKLKTPESSPRETFFAVEVNSETVKSAVWVVENKETQVLKVGTLEEWKESDEKSLVKAVDASISSVAEGIVPEPKGILFGLPEDWVDKEMILSDRKELLRQVCQKLDLKPLGFVVTLEALVQYFKAQQGTPLNAILIRVSESDLLVSLVLTGKISQNEIVGKTDDLVADVNEGLARFSTENFPPRMILYNGNTDFEEAKQQLLSYEWQKELPFLHFPKIESLSHETTIRAVAVAGGSEVAKALGIEVVETHKSEAEPETEAKAEKVAASKERAVEPEEEESDAKEQDQAEVVGVSDEVVSDKETETVLGSTLGFVKGRDILLEPPRTSKPEEVPEAKEIETDKGSHIEFKPRVPGETEEGEIESHPNLTGLRPRSVFSSLKSTFGSIFSFLRDKVVSGLSNLPGNRATGVLILVGVVFLVFLFGGLAFYWYVPKAEVVISVAPKILEKELTIQVDTRASSVGSDKSVIPGSLLEIERSGNLSAPTTGKKLVGDKATGTVSILNKTDASKTFESGTVLVGPKQLRFELAEEVKVASKSSEKVGDGEKITYGKATAKAVSADIGPDYNVNAGTEFTFKDYGTSLYSAKSESGLSGGTSREIKAISEEDQKKLLEKLTDNLKGEAKNQLQSQGGEGRQVLEQGMEAKVVKKEFSKKVGDEADSLSLDLTLRLTALSFSQNDFNTLLLQALANSLPGEFQLKTEDIATQIDKATVSGQVATIELVAKANLLPKYDLAALQDNLVGKYPPLVQSYLATLPNFVKADIKITPPLPGKLGTLPRARERIKITIKAQE